MAHINTYKKEDCCGCFACVDACPKKCITVAEDGEGFRYPVIDKKSCVDCGKCLSVCPFENSKKVKNELDNDESFAFVAKDDELIKSSSSSGAFWVIVEEFITKNQDNFAVFGAAFDGVDVVHMCAEDIETAQRFKKSKYVQSKTDGVFEAVKEKLKNGKSVLFSGTPCQVGALKAFLGQPYEKLLTVDIVCHGVPNQKTFSDYLDDLEKAHEEKVKSVCFRIKKDFDTENPNPRTVDITFESGNVINLDIQHCEYLYGFHAGLYMRPSCYFCRYATPERPADITLADFWGIEKLYPQMQSKKGVSLVRFNTQKGKIYVDALKQQGDITEASYKFACKENHQLLFPSIPSSKRTDFIILRRKRKTVTEAVNICKKPVGIVKKVRHKLESMYYNQKVKKIKE